jgi:hypothetical protein
VDQLGQVVALKDSHGLLAAMVTPELAFAGQWASADGGGSGGDMRLDKAGHRNRVMAYMQKQRTSLLRTLKVGSRANRRTRADSGSSGSDSRRKSWSKDRESQ